MTDPQVTMDAAKAAPPVAGTLMNFAGVHVNDWLALATLVYTVCLLITLWRDRWGGRELIRCLLVRFRAKREIRRARRR